jgi:hypothetical protein
MTDITNSYPKFTEWYFQELDRRPIIDTDEKWKMLDTALQIFGLGKNGGILCYSAGDLEGLEYEKSVLKTLGLTEFEVALAKSIISRNANDFDSYFFSHYDDLFKAAYSYAKSNGLFSD